MAGVTMGRIRRDIVVILLCALVAIAAAQIYSQSVEPRYRSVARMLVTPDNSKFEGRDLLTALDTLARTSVMPTYVEVLNSSRIRESAAVLLGFSSGSLEDYEIEAVALPEANIIVVTTEGTDPSSVAALTNAVVAEGSTYLGSRYAMYEIEVLDGAVAAGEPFAPNPPRDTVLAAVLGAGLGLAVVLGMAGLQSAIYVAPTPARTTRTSKVAPSRR